MTLSELKQQQQNVVAERERQIALKLQEDKKKSEEEMKRKKKEKKRLKKYQNKNKISFGDDEEIVEGLLLMNCGFNYDLIFRGRGSTTTEPGYLEMYKSQGKRYKTEGPPRISN